MGRVQYRALMLALTTGRGRSGIDRKALLHATAAFEGDPVRKAADPKFQSICHAIHSELQGWST